MSAIFRRNPSGCAAGKLGSQPQNHRPHRHKKFRVRPEALGKGYKTYEVLTQSSCLPPADAPAAPSVPEVEAAASPPAPAVTTPASEWQKVSEKETSIRAARNALRFWFWGFSVLMMLGFLWSYRDWLWRVVDWMYQFPFPTR